ncbi:hypothetical protein NDK47_13220 [Brevibacillus ruminantium]|uniref:Uncharacterized protein n=1 Tax=Brevibacillus ruminantium TaxID=2950604 RepID=A0ABY4WMA4_9BACL|nr:hypothetical protein [Brevibacillus ruminantium]USG68178.1 hypothetical protein NDK47_13220 [Brevibacillus ruminantium]
MEKQHRSNHPSDSHTVPTVKSSLDESEIDKRHQYQLFPTPDEEGTSEESMKLDL